MVDCMKEVCWKPLGVALSVVFGFLMFFFCVLSYVTARKIKGFDEEDDSIFEYHAPSLKSSLWSNIGSLLKNLGMPKRNQ